MPRRTPVGDTDQGLQPGEAEGTKLGQQALGAGGPAWALITGTKLHEGQPQRCFRALFAVEGEGGEAVALPDAAGEALGEKTSTGMRRHGTRSSARAAMWAVRYSPRSRNWEGRRPAVAGSRAWLRSSRGARPAGHKGRADLSPYGWLERLQPVSPEWLDP